MSTTHIILIVAGAVVGLGIIGFAAFMIRTILTTRKRIPIDTGGPPRTVARDVPFTKELTLDVYGPQDGDKTHPLVLLVPGDGPRWLIKNAKEWGIFQSYAEICASRGYLVAVMNHRSSDNFKHSVAMAQDVLDALDALRERADDLKADADRIIVWTFSGSSGPVLSQLVRKPEQGVKGLLSFYGFLDLSTYPMKVPQEVLAYHSLPQVLEHVDTIPCPVYLLGAGKDSKMIARGFKRTTDLLSTHDWPVTTRIYPQGPHAFEITSPPDQVQAEIDRAFTFISDCLDS